LNIGAQLETFLYATVTYVLKITLLHSVSVITNFIIPKRDKKNKQKNKHHTFSSSAGT